MDDLSRLRAAPTKQTLTHDDFSCSRSVKRAPRREVRSAPNCRHFHSQGGFHREGRRHAVRGEADYNSRGVKLAKHMSTAWTTHPRAWSLWMRSRNSCPTAVR